MKCFVGDSIHAENIDGYESLLGRVDFCTNMEHELKLSDIQSMYDSVKEKMSDFNIENAELITDFSNMRTEKCTLSIVISRNSAFDYVSTETQIVRIATYIQNSMILKYGNMKYVCLIKKRLRSSLYKLGKSYLKSYYSGYYVYDLECELYGTQGVEKFLQSIIPKINAHMESCNIVTIRLNSEQIKPSDYNLMVGTVNRSMFKDLVERYQDWYNFAESDKVEILEQDIRASIHLMLNKKLVDKSQIMIKIAQRDDKWVIGFYSNLSISPYLIIKELYPKVKLNEIYHNSEFLIAGVYKGLSRVNDNKLISGESRTCTCGHELVYDMVNSRVSRVCPECQMRLLMSNFINRR